MPTILPPTPPGAGRTPDAARRPRRRLRAGLAVLASAAAAAGICITGSPDPVRPVQATAYPKVQPAAETSGDYTRLAAGATPPTGAQCASAGRRCFGPQAIRAAYNLGPLLADGKDGRGRTIAVFDSYGSDTMAHDLHVFDKAFGVQAMCGEEDAACTDGMPTFSELHLQGDPATKAPPPASKGTGQEDKSAWALETALDVETAHAIAPGANILLVTTPTAETLGQQGFPQLMAAETYVAEHHLADVMSQSFGSAEAAFHGTGALQKLHGAFEAARDAGVSVLASSGDGGSANGIKTPVGKGGTGIPEPTVEWPASDPLVTAVGGTYLCTDAAATSGRTTDSTSAPSTCGGVNSGQSEIGWTGSGGGYSDVFAAPSYQAAAAAAGGTRGVPDVALQAAPSTGALVYVSLPPDGDSGLKCGDAPCSTGWYDIGGTSLAAPQWAGMVAIAAQLHGGATGLGQLNPALYRIAADPARYRADFHDVTAGTNAADPAVPGYPAGPGWDPVTGLGTPNAASLLPDLAQ